jgi:hypothetical protein
VEVALSAERAVENDVNMDVSYQLVVDVAPAMSEVCTSWSRSLRMADRSCAEFIDAQLLNCAIG